MLATGFVKHGVRRIESTRVRQYRQICGLKTYADGIGCRMRFFLALTTCLQLLSSSVVADVDTLKFRQAALNSALKRVTPALVSVQDGFGAGSGVVVSADGIVLTASHVVKPPAGIRSRRRTFPLKVVFPDGSEYPAKLLGMNETADAAMLKIEGKYRNGSDFPFVELGTSSELERGEWCFALGHPGGFNKERPAPLRLGRILSVGHHTVVSDCAIVLGDSGGPLFNLSGELIGIHSMITEVIVENRHVAIDVFRRDGDRMENHGSWGKLNSRDDELVQSGFFGVEIRWRDFVAEIDSIDRGSPAYRAGLRTGDELLSINSQAFADALGLNTLLDLLEENQEVEVKYRRNLREQITTLTTGRKPTDDELYAIKEEGIRPSSVEHLRELKNQLTVLRKVGPFEKRSPDQMQHFESIVAPSKNSVVEFQSFGAPLTLGTIMTEDGYILTKASELDNSIDPDCVLPDGRRLKIREIGVDRSFDLMLVKVDAKGLQPVQWSSAEPPEVGQIVVSTDSRGTAHLPGVISVKNRRLATASRGFLGVQMDFDDRARAVFISSVLPGGAAERAGIRKDDVILEINGRRIGSTLEMKQAISSNPPDSKITIRLESSNVIKTVNVLLSPQFVADGNEVLLPRYREDSVGKFSSRHNSGFPEAMQHDTDLFPSQCGGPLLDLSGKAIGMNIARSARVVSYAIPSKAVQQVYTRLRQQEKASLN